MRAAAHELGVSEPAVSAAVAALRRELGDELVVRSGMGIAITPGGRRLATRAVEILGLAHQARREVAEARGEDTVLRVAAGTRLTEDVAPPLLDAFARRFPRLEVVLRAEPVEAFGDLLATRTADVVLGPRPLGAPDLGIQWVPFLRHQMVVVAAPDHPLAGQRDVAFTAVSSQRWLAGPLGLEPATTEGAWLARQRAWPREIRAFPTHAGALAAARQGEGVTFTGAHRAGEDLRRGTLARLDIRGTPLIGFWYGSVLARDAVPPAVRALLRFITTPDATQAMLSGAPSGRFRPPVYVTIWR